MNTADRSIAMVDYALRRRFGFVDLVPGFNTDQFQSYLTSKGATQDFVDSLIGKINALNHRIALDKANLGPGFCIGHSFFTALEEGQSPDAGWYNSIVQNELAPLLQEYWFDTPESVESIIRDLQIT